MNSCKLNEPYEVFKGRGKRLLNVTLGHDKNELMIADDAQVICVRDLTNGPIGLTAQGDHLFFDTPLNPAGIKRSIRISIDEETILSVEPFVMKTGGQAPLAMIIGSEDFRTTKEILAISLQTQIVNLMVDEGELVVQFGDKTAYQRELPAEALVGID